MAVATYTRVRSNVVGAERQVDVTVACDDDYPTGGYPLTAAEVGLNQIFAVSSAVGAGFVFQYVPASLTAGNLFAFETDGDGGPLVQASSSADLSAVTALPLVVRGI